MPDVRTLIESANARGLTLFLADGKVQVRAPHDLDADTKAILQELREHKDNRVTTGRSLQVIGRRRKEGR